MAKDYEKKIERLKVHLGKHPADYQAVIGLVKANSDRIDQELYEQRIMQLRKLSHYRRLYNEERTQ